MGEKIPFFPSRVVNDFFFVTTERKNRGVGYREILVITTIVFRAFSTSFSDLHRR